MSQKEGSMAGKSAAPAGQPKGGSMEGKSAAPAAASKEESMAGKSTTAAAPPGDSAALEGRMIFWLTFSVLAVALGSSFIFGYNIGVINAAGGVIKRWICNHTGMKPPGSSLNCSTVENGTCSWDDIPDREFLEKLTGTPDGHKLTTIWSFVVGMFPLGAMIGGLSTGFVADRAGRKCGMLLNLILTFIAGGTMAASYFINHYGVLIAGRFMIGINAGLNSGLAPMYLSEIAPKNLRGSLGSVNQLSVTISILVSNILGLSSILGTKTLWPMLLLFTIVPAIYQLCTMPLCPESPKYLLISKGQSEAARNGLVKLRGKPDVDAEFSVMQKEADEMKAAKKVEFKDMFTDSLLRWALFIAIMMMLSQQLSGINATMFYSTLIFERDARMTTESATYATLAMLTVNVLMTIVSTVMVEKAGRKTLLMIGMCGMWVATASLVLFLYLSSLKKVEGEEVLKFPWAPYLSIAFVIIFVIFFATGPGSIPWFYVSELFEMSARGNANSVAVGVNWFATSIIGFGFGPMNEVLTIYSFLVFTGFLTLFILFTIRFVPETKNLDPPAVMEKLKQTKC